MIANLSGMDSSPSDKKYRILIASKKWLLRYLKCEAKNYRYSCCCLCSLASRASSQGANCVRFWEPKPWYQNFSRAWLRDAAVWYLVGAVFITIIFSFYSTFIARCWQRSTSLCSDLEYNDLLGCNELQTKCSRRGTSNVVKTIFL